MYSSNFAIYMCQITASKRLSNEEHKPKSKASNQKIKELKQYINVCESLKSYNEDPVIRAAYKPIMVGALLIGYNILTQSVYGCAHRRDCNYYEQTALITNEQYHEITLIAAGSLLATLCSAVTAPFWKSRLEKQKIALETSLHLPRYSENDYFKHLVRSKR